MGKGMALKGGADNTKSVFRVTYDGSIVAAGKLKINAPENAEGAEVYPDGRLFQRVDNIDDDKPVYGVYSGGYDQNASTIQFFKNGNITADGTITPGTVVFNLEPDNDANYTTTTDVNGAEVNVYSGPTLDVKETLLALTGALENLKTAAASATTCEQLRTAIETALANI